MIVVFTAIQNINYSLLIIHSKLGSYQSGQLGLTVTQLSFDFGGSNPSLPTIKYANELICQCANINSAYFKNWHIGTL